MYLARVEPRAHEDGVLLVLERAGHGLELIVRRRALGHEALAWSDDWELLVPHRDDDPRDKLAMAAVLRTADGIEGLTALAEPDYLADYVPRVIEKAVHTETMAVLTGYRPPRLIRSRLFAGAAWEGALEEAGKVVSYLCESHPPELRSEISVCDVGAGLGLLVGVLRAAGFSGAHGVDRMWHRVLAAKLAGLPVEYADARDLDQHVGLQHLDAVSFVRVFDAPDVTPRCARRMLKASSRALRAGGVLLIGAPGRLFLADLENLGLRRVRWDNPPCWGQHLQVFRKTEAGSRAKIGP
jgi:2-polyprenyl-3-methyl-5-hydroxy-6-metoxy-1,4-benzoquinol methylase